MKHYPFQEDKPNWFERNKWYLVAIGIILIWLLVYNFPVQAQDTIPKYEIKISKKLVSGKIYVTYYRKVGQEQGAPISIVSGGGGGTKYIPMDSICRHRARCGYPTIEISYNPHSSIDVLFNTEKCLFDNMNDILIGIDWVYTHMANYHNPDTSIIYFSGYSWGAMVHTYLAYHTDIADKLVSNWGGVLKLNMIDKNIPTLLIHGTNDNLLPYNEGYAFKNNPLIGKIVYLYGSKKINEWSLDRGYDSELMTWNNYGHGLTKTGTDTNKNLRIANNKAIKFLYQ